MCHWHGLPLLPVPSSRINEWVLARLCCLSLAWFWKKISFVHEDVERCGLQLHTSFMVLILISEKGVRTHLTRPWEILAPRTANTETQELEASWERAFAEVSSCRHVLIPGKLLSLQGSVGVELANQKPHFIIMSIKFPKERKENYLCLRLL